MLVLLALGACAGSREPAAPLLPGGQLGAGLVGLLGSATLAARAPALGPASVVAPAPLPPPPAPRSYPVTLLPPPPKPAFAIGWIPALKPRLDADPPRIVWPSPRRPDPPGLAIEPAAGPPSAPAATVPVRVEHRAPRRCDPGDTIAVVDPADDVERLDRAARAALRAGDPATALALYERLSARLPDEPTVLLGRALALARLGRTAEAQAVYQLLLERGGEDLGARIAMIGVVAERAPGEALRLLRGLARRHPQDPRLFAQIGLVLARLGRTDAAIAELRRALALAPDSAENRANLAILLDRAGRTGEAIVHYRQAVAAATTHGLPGPRLAAIAARLAHLAAPHEQPSEAPAVEARSLPDVYQRALE